MTVNLYEVFNLTRKVRKLFKSDMILRKKRKKFLLLLNSQNYTKSIKREIR